MLNHLIASISHLKQEWRTLQLLSTPPKEPSGNLVIYSEHAAYGKFFEPIIQELIKSTSFSYLSSDLRDPVFDQKTENLKTFYIKNLLGGLFPQLEAKAVVLTMPDLERFHIKKSQKGTEHIYLFHALVSTHMIYRQGAFDAYDTVLCAGAHHCAEIRAAEKLYGLKPKKLIEAGYPLLDKIAADYQVFLEAPNKKENRTPVVLIAPSWGPQNIMVTCLEALVKSIRASGFEIIIRPHPEFIKRRPKEVETLNCLAQKTKGIELELYPSHENSLFRADVLVTDWSGIAFEFALGTERPVLFIDTPRKVFNPDYEKLGIEPVEVSSRGQLGVCLSPLNSQRAGAAVAALLGQKEQYAQVIQEKRSELVFNFGSSAKVISEYLKGFLK